MNIKTWFGMAVLIIGVILIPAILVHGLFTNRIFNPFNFGIAQIAITGRAPAMFVTKLKQPAVFWSAVAFWSVLTILVIWLVYAFLFLSEYAIS